MRAVAAYLRFLMLHNRDNSRSAILNGIHSNVRCKKLSFR
jgi:hypothetical protein